MKLMQDFITPPGHVNFFAKKLFDYSGEMIDGSIAYLEANGGGPTELHTHEHHHIFIVIQGEAKIVFNDRNVIIRENESYLVQGNVPHSVWNNRLETTIMVGISVK